MRPRPLALAVLLAGLVGCVPVPTRPEARPGDLVPVAAFDEPEVLPPPKEKPAEPEPSPPPPPVAGDTGTLPQLLALALKHNPRLAQVGWAIDAAHGRAVQAALYPNPTLALTGDEIADRTGPVGILSVTASQEIVTAGKLGLNHAAARKEVDRATLDLVAERYRTFTEVRQAFYDLLTLRHRAGILESLVELAGRSVANAEKLVKAKEAARLDVVQLEVDRERYAAELDATRRALPGACARLAAAVGVAELPWAGLSGGLDPLPPDYDLARLRAAVVAGHPEVKAAQANVERAKLLLRRAEVEPHPNVTVQAGYTYQGQNRSNDLALGLSLPVPLWNKNEGNVHAARAHVNEAVNQIGRAQAELSSRLAAAHGTYASARRRAERFSSAVLPKARETLALARKGYQGGQFEYLRVLQAQRAVAEAELELNRSLGEAWRAACEIAGLALDDHFPTPRPHP